MDSSDYDQAAEFKAMLRAEIISTSDLVDEAERASRSPWNPEGTPNHRYYAAEAIAQRTVLYDLYRQLDALNRRFPDAAEPN